MGMKYTNDPLMEGFCKLLVNYDTIDNGESITPRGALLKLSDTQIGADTVDYITHHVHTMHVEDTIAQDADLMRYALFGPQSPDGKGIMFADSQLIIEDEVTKTVTKVTLDPTYTGNAVIKHRDNSGWNTIHGMEIKNPVPEGLFASVENQTYVLCEDAGTKFLGRLKIYYDGTYKYTLETVDPSEITPAEAVNYGYNMLDDDPYNFINESNANGALSLLGILPYDPETDEIKFSAKVGEHIKFICNYSYPDSFTGKYKVQWETKDLTQANSDVIVQRYAANSAEYNPGDEIAFTYPSPFKQFTVIVKFFDSTDLATPIKVMQLPSYYLSSDAKGTTYNISPKNYDLNTATGMMSWNGRLVLWGVKGAETVLFTSDANNVSYFPFPQFIDTFDEPIVGAMGYLGDLMVFTTSQLIKVTLDEDYIYMMHEVVQEKLYLSKYDVNTITLIKNMIYFKSNDYFYMVVPKSDLSQPNAIQLAPISTPMQYFLDNFEETVRDIISTVYEIGNILGGSAQDFGMNLEYYYNYLDGEQLKNIYKFKLYRVEDPDNYYHLELSINYDTLLRNWKIYMYQTNDKRLMPYRQYVTDSTVYLNVYKNNGNAYVQFLQQDDSVVVDTIEQDNEQVTKFENFHYIDTGYRDQSNNTKKRFRELQYMVNNISKKDLEFYLGFYVDDDSRKELFTYEVQHVVDDQDPNYGLIYIDRQLVDPQFVQGVTALGLWRLGFSQMPGLSVVKVRTAVSGKGYAGRIKLLSKNRIKFTILNNTWVYRLMNMR
jgi:hypothetical protein